MEDITSILSSMTEPEVSSLEGFYTGELLIKSSQERLAVLKGLYRTQLGLDGVHNDAPAIHE